VGLLINSPRSLEAFKRTGILPEELDPVNHAQLREAIASRNPTRTVNRDVFELRLLYANKARHKKLQLLKEVRTVKSNL